MKMTQEKLSELLHKQVKDIVGPVVERVQEQVSENQKKHEEQQKEFMAQVLATKGANVDREKSVEERSLKAARYIRLMMAANGDPSRAKAIAEKKWGDIEMVAAVDKALGESTLAGGGALVPEDMAESVIEFLRARAVVRRAGAMSLPMPNGTLTLPRIAQGATAAYGGESQNITNSDQQFGQIVMTARKLAVLTPVSNELLADASPQVDALVRDDLVQAASVREDLAFIRGDGASNTPKGMLNWAVAGNKFNSAGTTVANVTDDLGTALQNLEDANIPLVRPGWLFAPRTKKALMTARGSDGQLIFQPEMSQGTLMGFPFFVTTQIPTNLGGGTNESEVYLADFAQMMIGETAEMDVRVFDGATYFDGSQLQSGVSRDETVIRLTMRHDFAPRFVGNDISVIEAVTWDSITP